MNNKPLISIVTPCFNSEKTIERTFDSILQQDFELYEYIVVDGGSTDGTIDIIKEYVSRFNGKMKYISERDKGIYDAMNKGIKMSKGMVIGIINSDDYYEKNTLQEVANIIDSTCKYQVIYGAMRIVNEKEEELEISIHKHNNIKNKMMHHPSCFISRNIYFDIAMYDLSFRYSADYDFLLKLSENMNVRFTPTYKILSNFTVGGSSYSAKAFQETNVIRYKYGLISKRKYTLDSLKFTLQAFLTHR